MLESILIFAQLVGAILLLIFLWNVLPYVLMAAIGIGGIVLAGYGIHLLVRYGGETGAIGIVFALIGGLVGGGFLYILYCELRVWLYDVSRAFKEITARSRR